MQLFVAGLAGMYTAAWGAYKDAPFERFSRAQKTTADGSGLGLAIVETIAEAHHGTTRADNARDGADVWISVPNRSAGTRRSQG